MLIFAWNCVLLLINKMYTLTVSSKFGWNTSKSDKIMLSQPGQPPFLTFRSLFSPVACWWLWKEPVCWWWDEDAACRMATWTWTELLQMFEVTTAGSHAFSQAVVEVRRRLVNVFLCQLFPDGLQGDFQLISSLIRLEFMVFFLHNASDVIVQRVQTWRAWGPLIFTALHEMPARTSNEKAVRPSVCLSVYQTRDLWMEKKLSRFYTIRKTTA